MNENILAVIDNVGDVWMQCEIDRWATVLEDEETWRRPRAEAIFSGDAPLPAFNLQLIEDMYGPVEKIYALDSSRLADDETAMVGGLMAACRDLLENPVVDSPHLERVVEAAEKVIEALPHAWMGGAIPAGSIIYYVNSRGVARSRCVEEAIQPGDRRWTEILSAAIEWRAIDPKTGTIIREGGDRR